MTPPHTPVKYDVRKTRLYELLDFLKPKHQKKILQIIKVEFNKPQDKQGLLVEAILKHIKKKQDKPLYKEALISLIGMESQKMNYLISDIFKRACKILPLTSILQEYEHQQTQMLAYFFNKNDLIINKEYALEDIKKSLKRKAQRDHDFHYYQMKYHELRVRKDRDSKQYSDDLRLMIENLDAFYAETKLRLLCEEYNRNRIIQQPSEVFKNKQLERDFLQTVIKTNFYNSPSVQLYYNVYQMLMDNQESSYQKVYALTHQSQNVFPTDTQAPLIHYLMNQCLFFVNKNIRRSFYSQQYLEHFMYLEALGEILDKDQNFPLGIFHNIVVMGVLTQQQQWGETFINARTSELDTDNKRFIQLLHLAYVYFDQGALNQAQDCILAIDELPKDDVSFVLLYYKLSIQILLQTSNNNEVALNRSEALRKYCKRIYDKGTLAKDKYTILNNFTTFFKRIVTIDPKIESTKWQKLLQDFSSKFNEIAYAKWLQTIIDDKNNRK